MCYNRGNRRLRRKKNVVWRFCTVHVSASTILFLSFCRRGVPVPHVRNRFIVRVITAALRKGDLYATILCCGAHIPRCHSIYLSYHNAKFKVSECLALTSIKCRFRRRQPGLSEQVCHGRNIVEALGLGLLPCERDAGTPPNSATKEMRFTQNNP